MHVDLDRGGAQSTFGSRFCIVGGGIAGLLLAHRLAERGASVHLLEAGGLELEDRSQALFDAELQGEPHTGTTEGRFRAFGGSSIRWGGQLLPYTPDIFSPPSTRFTPPWPITGSELAPYTRQLEELMHTGALPFDETLLESMGQTRPPFSAGIRVRFSKWAPFRRRNLAHTLGALCLAHPRITVFTHANVAALHGAGGRVVSARALNYAGRAFQFEAESFIVAAGVVESVRLLLASPDVPDPQDQFGRYFRDHVATHAAVVPPAAWPEIERRLGPFFVDGVLHTCNLEATAEMQEEHGLLAVMAHFVIVEPEDGGMAAVRALLTAVQRRTRVTSGMLAAVLRGSGDVLRLAWSTRVRRRRGISKRAQVFVNIDMEQPARAESRIRLAETRDALGLSKAIVEWQIGPEEQETASRFARLMGEEFAQAGFGPVEWSPDLLAGRPVPLAGTYHAMGGLRMGVDPRCSVVDANLQVHGMQNLSVASCAVFPSGGSSNPTFTLMHLALRLADRLLG